MSYYGVVDMHSTPLRVKLENVKKLIRREAKGPMYKLLNKLHPADIAYIIKNLQDIDRRRIWGYLHDKERLAGIILELDEPDIIEFFTGVNPNKAADVLMEMESDDVTFVLRLLPEEIRRTVLESIEASDLSEVEELLHYPEKTAGAMMNTEYIAISEDTTVKEATKLIHQAEDIELVYYLYVTDSENRLTGVLSLRQLILNPPEKCLKDIMTKDVIFVLDDTNREDVAQLVAKYDFMALPVVDEGRHLVGVITFDDIIDVIQDEAAEDIYKITGTSQDALDAGVVKSARVRLPWLFITLIGGLFSGVVITHYQGRVNDFLVLASFMPVIMAMGGNVGSQSSTLTVRGLALGNVDPRRMWPVLFKELRVGLLMGITSAIPISIIAPFVNAGSYVGIIVGVSLFCAMSFAAFTGTLVPMMLIRFRVDPAVASGPFISMLNDITGLTIYFTVAITLLSFLK